MAKKDKAIFYL